jgi:2-oxo-3-(phosphooxy)propyl 3-oxoalkanoate synthase
VEPTLTPMVLTHRTSTQDTFATTWTSVGEHHFRVRILLPNDHPFFTPSPGGYHDPLLIVEAMRQASIMVGHAGHGIPMDNHFILSGIEFACRPEYLGVGSGPTELELDVVLSHLEYSAGRPSFLHYNWVLWRCSDIVATGVAPTHFISPRAYHRLRNGQTTPGKDISPGPVLAPRAVGREHAQDVLLAPGDQPHQWRLAVDTCHPTLFQRPNDHIPGMVLLEAARQAAYTLLSPAPFVPSAGRITFQRYVEFDSPCLITARTIQKTADRQSTQVSINGVQENQSVFNCMLEAPAVSC